MSGDSELSEGGHAALREIVTIARKGARSVEEMKATALAHDLPEADVDEAISFWGRYLRETYPDLSDEASP